MEHHLGESDWFGGDAMNIADFALYAYTHVAGEGGFELGDYPAVSAWLERVAAQPGHVPMNPAPEGVVHPAPADRPRSDRRRSGAAPGMPTNRGRPGPRDGERAP